tara:strand:+ start:936 stop:1151 length:216 start_codon:yes stop_codon:yes gene_type:complete
MKKNCVEIRKIKGKISKSVDGVFRAVKIKGRKKFESIFLKKEISSKILKIKIKHKKIKEIVSIFLRYNLIK